MIILAVHTLISEQELSLFIVLSPGGEGNSEAMAVWQVGHPLTPVFGTACLSPRWRSWLLHRGVLHAHPAGGLRFESGYGGCGEEVVRGNVDDLSRESLYLPGTRAGSIPVLTCQPTRQVPHLVAENRRTVLWTLVSAHRRHWANKTITTILDWLVLKDIQTNTIV